MSTSELRAIAVGSSVTVGYPANAANSVPGVVTGVQIGEGNLVTFYRVAWWDGRTRREEWLSPTEVVPGESVTACRIGFTGQKDERILR
ncbi:hypothetical protein [Limnoglobus roseus]|uniref:Uncharacterized protein n=1 Tax=Limnoglobus roseus TaxID=2598579 RepID=A0A5C1AHI8_9BACT|nr:hypothetical protein [Limnoglobus roseus]QEL18300.1 hypothetical protein PX52LOC_05321 [Limnoglobus roseus]